jgi:hypothetical protein
MPRAPGLGHRIVAGLTGTLEVAGEMSALGQKRTLRRVQTMSALPPKADISAFLSDVRFTPKSGHWRSEFRCPLCANSGLMHCSKVVIRSPSARPSIGSGMAKPSALPVFRSNVGRGFLSTRNSSLMRRNNCLRAVSCFNFSLFHFCHTLNDSSSSPQEQTEQIL